MLHTQKCNSQKWHKTLQFEFLIKHWIHSLQAPQQLLCRINETPRKNKIKTPRKKKTISTHRHWHHRLLNAADGVGHRGCQVVHSAEVLDTRMQAIDPHPGPLRAKRTASIVHNERQAPHRCGKQRMGP